MDNRQSTLLLTKLSFIAVLLALSVIALGAFTRLVDAGLGCPDWPGCYGHLIVPMTKSAQAIANIQYPQTPLIAYKAWAEMLHRYVVGGLSLFILMMITTILICKETRNRTNLLFSGGLILLLVYQILLGQWTVTLKLLPIIVTQHLLGGFMIVSLLWLVYLNNSKKFSFNYSTNISTNISTVKDHSNNSFSNSFLYAFCVIAIFLLISQILLGAWTSTNYASLSCKDFPFCMKNVAMQFHLAEAYNFSSPVGINYDGGVLAEPIRQTIQMMHRLGAVLVTIFLFALCASTFYFSQVSIIQKTIYAILALLSLQIGLGISNVIFKLPLWVAVFHNVIAAVLLLALISLTFFIKKSANLIKMSALLSSETTRRIQYASQPV